MSLTYLTCRFLADSQAPAMGGVAARTILVSSPNRGHYKVKDIKSELHQQKSGSELIN